MIGKDSIDKHKCYYRLQKVKKWYSLCFRIHVGRC